MNSGKIRLIIASLIAIGILGVVFFNPIKSALQSVGRDYSGPGAEEILFTIEQGDTGENIASDLAKLDIVKDFGFTYKLMIQREQTFIPGTFNLLTKMKSSDALDRLEDPAFLAVNRVTIREGLRIGTVFKELSAATGISVAEFKAVTLGDLGLSAKLPSLEGYLFPATYDFGKDISARRILQQMVDRTIEEMTSFGVPESRWHSVLTMASIIEKEARLKDDFYRVSRVFSNRIKVGMHLQSDATVSYGSGGTTVTTTDAERADPNGYNTYVHAGLPVGPISAPGATAIDAALNPTKGDWLFFCTVNLKTGETVFSETMAQHEVAVAQWQRWMRENPGWNG
jgi:UPF0755 protein